MVKYLLDTDICSYIIRENPLHLLKKFNEVGSHKLCISSVTYAELFYGAQKRNSKELTCKIQMLTSLLEIVPFDKLSAQSYVKIRYDLEVEGEPIGNMDILIASCAVANNLILVSNNTKHFSKIKKLQIENWVL